jgi:hypothetical protein
MVNKPVITRVEKKSAPKMSLGRTIVVYTASACVLVVIVASLWIAAMAIGEKVKIAHGVSQIVDIVDLIRRMASVEAAVGKVDREDLMLHLAQRKQIEPMNGGNGRQMLMNPWNGTLIAYTVGSNAFRLENIVPSRICTRITGLLAGSLSSAGMLQIDVNGGDGWRQIYSEANHGVLRKEDISAGCRRDQNVDLAMTFTLR